MSGYKGHVFGAVFLTALLIFSVFSLGRMFGIEFLNDFFKSPSELIVLIPVAILFSLFPDIDTNSIGQKLFYLIFFCLDIFLIVNKDYILSAILGLFCFLPVLSKHRGWTHNKITALLICSPFLVIPFFVSGFSMREGFLYFSMALTGYFSHLLIDGVFFK